MITPGSRSRRIAVGTAVWTIAALSGCHAVPVGRLTSAPPIPKRITDSSQPTIRSVGRAALFPATVALDNPSELAAIDPSNSDTGTITRASAINTSGRASLISTELQGPSEPLPPTPLLDAALVQARNKPGLPVDPAPKVETVELAVGPATEPATPSPPPLAAAVMPIIPANSSEPAPLMTSVKVTPPPVASEVKPAEGSEARVTPEEVWREGVRKLVDLARQKRDQAGTNANELWELRTKVLTWLSEPDIDPDLVNNDGDGVRAILRVLETPASSHEKPTGDDVRTALRVLEVHAPLELVDLQICQAVERFGEVTPFKTPGRQAGDWIGLYCEVDGLHQEPTASGFQAQLAARLEIIPVSGGPSLALPLLTSNQTFPRRRRDYYVSYSKELPRDLQPGQYTLRVTLQDLSTSQAASRETTLIIVGDGSQDNVAAGPQLPIQNP